MPTPPPPPVPRQAPTPGLWGGWASKGADKGNQWECAGSSCHPPSRPAQSAHTPSCHLAALLGRPAPLLWRQLWGSCSWVIIANIHPASCPPQRAGERAARPGEPLLARPAAAPWPGTAPTRGTKGRKACRRQEQTGRRAPAGASTGLTRTPPLSLLPPITSPPLEWTN